jgi:hypothetical protein
VSQDAPAGAKVFYARTIDHAHATKNGMSALSRTTSGSLGKEAALRVARETPGILRSPRQRQRAVPQPEPEPEPDAGGATLVRGSSGEMGRQAARRVVTLSPHWSRRNDGPAATEAAGVKPRAPPEFKAEVKSASTDSFLAAEEAKAAAFQRQMQLIEAESAASPTVSKDAPPSTAKLEYEQTVDKTNALIEETDQLRAETRAEYSSGKYWQQTVDPDAYDPTSNAEQLRRLNAHRSFLAEQRDKNIKSLQAGQSPVLARQKSAHAKLVAAEAEKEERRQKEQEEISGLVDELAKVDAEIERLRNQAKGR